MTVPAGGAYPKVLPALIALGDVIRLPEGMSARVVSKEQEPGEATPVLFGYATRTGVRGTCPFPADQAVTLLHSAGSRAA
jgi:hypothetical protein